MRTDKSFQYILHHMNRSSAQCIARGRYKNPDKSARHSCRLRSQTDKRSDLGRTWRSWGICHSVQNATDDSRNKETDDICSIVITDTVIIAIVIANTSTRQEQTLVRNVTRISVSSHLGSQSPDKAEGERERELENELDTDIDADKDADTEDDLEEDGVTVGDGDVETDAVNEDAVDGEVNSEAVEVCDDVDDKVAVRERETDLVIEDDFV
jgi:hypothetical protein